MKKLLVILSQLDGKALNTQGLYNFLNSLQPVLAERKIDINVLNAGAYITSYENGVTLLDMILPAARVSGFRVQALVLEASEATEFWMS